MMTTGQSWVFIMEFILMCVIMVLIATGTFHIHDRAKRYFAWHKRQAVRRWYAILSIAEQLKARF